MLPRLTPFASAIAFSACLTVSSLAEAQSRVALFGTFGFSGEAEGELDVPPLELKNNVDLNQTVGLGLSSDKALHRHFALGVLGRLYSWEADNYSWSSGDHSGLGFDAALLPRLKFPMQRLELYGAVPIGLTAASKDDSVSTLGEVEYDLGFGYNVGLLVGVQFHLTRQLGLFGEFGRQIRRITHDVEAKSGNATAELTYTSRQWVANIGLAFL